MMKKTVFAVLALVCGITLFAKDDIPEGWSDNYPAALRKAKAEKKNILVLFTGSDWCGFCIRLKKDVLDRKEFQRVAPAVYELVYFDFPNRKKISASQMKMQRELADKWGVDGYPTTVIVSPEGEKIKSIVGYRNPEMYLKELFPGLGKADAGSSRKR
ncbi:MAG: thioredoxin family protein [Lentisphaeria bacterium]|nr:thioredoxin family protein [Lentisphaeria bacterium]